MTQKILLVDDEPDCTAFLGLALEQEGFDVRTATRVAEALSIGGEFHPDILITDWMLKDETDGIEVARLLSEDDSQLRTIFITGMNRQQIESRIPPELEASVVVKPVEIENLLSLIRSS